MTVQLQNLQEAAINAKIKEIKDAETAAANKKASGKAKLKELKIDDAEIEQLLGRIK